MFLDLPVTSRREVSNNSSRYDEHPMIMAAPNTPDTRVGGKKIAKYRGKIW